MNQFNNNNLLFLNRFNLNNNHKKQLIFKATRLLERILFKKNRISRLQSIREIIKMENIMDMEYYSMMDLYIQDFLRMA